MKQSSQPRSLLRQRIQHAISGVAVGGLLAAALYFFSMSSVDLISGVINEYAAVTHLDVDKVAVSDASAFSSGDRVLLIQMQGATISEAEDATYGDINNYGSAGQYEFARVSSISGDTLRFEQIICRDFEVSGNLQVVRVPEYEEVELSGPLTAPAWNGQTGGIVVLWANGTVFLNDDIEVSGAGFLGGEFNGSSSSAGLIYGCSVSSGRGGFKGQGIASPSVDGCRGKAANGGGGGNDHNGGGGGGSNYGAGGLGGHGWKSGTPGSDTDKGGRGGVAMADWYASSSNRVFLGGGGGGGHQNNGASIPAGDGGGIVFLIADQVEVQSTVTIDASGEDAQDVTVNDGASGGGGGGSIFLQVNTWTNAHQLTLDAAGGDGADLYTASQHGPGGGGGGGVIITASPLPGSITTTLSGGAAGTFFSSSGSSNMHHNSSHGATAGTDGAVISDAILRICTAPPQLDLDGSTSGHDYETNCYPGVTTPAIGANNQVNINDDSTTIYAATVSLINPMDGSEEALSIEVTPATLAGYGITATVAPDGHSVSLTGASSLAHYETVLAAILYSNSASSPDMSDRLLEVQVEDGGSWSNVAQTTIVMMDPASLPVEWGAMSARWDNGSAVLQWETLTESNNDFFVVERSEDGRLFQPAGQVEAEGSSQVPLNYAFTDREAMPSNTYFYRLRQVDIDGQYAYSRLVELAPVDGMATIELRIFPNPASDQVTISWQQSALSASLEVMDLQGRRLHQSAIRTSTGESRLDISAWPAGTYLVRMRSDGQIESRKLIKR